MKLANNTLSLKSNHARKARRRKVYLANREYLYLMTGFIKKATRITGECDSNESGSLLAMDGSTHGLINYKDPKTQCRLYWCLIEFIDWTYSQSRWNFRPSFVN